MDPVAADLLPLETVPVDPAAAEELLPPETVPVDQAAYLVAGETVSVDLA